MMVFFIGKSLIVVIYIILDNKFNGHFTSTTNKKPILLEKYCRLQKRFLVSEFEVLTSELEAVKRTFGRIKRNELVRFIIAEKYEL